MAFLLEFLKKEFREECGMWTGFILRFGAVILPGFVFYYLSRIVDTTTPSFQVHFGGAFFPFFIAGMAVYRFAYTILFRWPTVVYRERWRGTLESLWLGKYTPVSLVLVLGIWPFVEGLVNFFGLIMVGKSLAPSIFQNAYFPELLGALVFAVFLYAAFGLMAVALALVVNRASEMLQIFNFIDIFFSGLFFPTAILPSPLRWISEFLPMTHLLRLVRFGLTGNVETALAESLLLSIFIAGAVPLAALFLHFAICKIEEEGRLAVWG